MSYFGVRVSVKEQFYITVKIHGPLDTFVINPQALKKVVAEEANRFFERSDNIPELCFELSEFVKLHYLDGNDMVWVDIEVFTKNNLLFGASAEKVLT